MTMQKRIAYHQDLYPKLTRHFSAVKNLKTQLEALQAKELSQISAESKAHADSDIIWQPSTQYQNLEQELVHNLEQEHCTQEFEELLLKSADTSLISLINYGDYLHLIENWSTPIDQDHQDPSRSAILDLHETFFKEASFHTNYNFPIPEQVPYVPHGKKERVTKFGYFTEAPKPKIYINVFFRIFNSRATRFSNTVVHEDTHALQAHMANQFKLGKLNALLKPMLYDALYWNLRNENNANISPNLSFKAYAAQPTEVLARKIGFHLQRNLEKIMIQHNMNITTPIQDRAYLPSPLKMNLVK